MNSCWENIKEHLFRQTCKGKTVYPPSFGEGTMNQYNGKFYQKGTFYINPVPSISLSGQEDFSIPPSLAMTALTSLSVILLLISSL